jgi:nicotinamide-nucleotide amidase
MPKLDIGQVDDASRDRIAAILEEADRQELMIATAESCTGGLLAALLTDVEGVSHVFERGFVVYGKHAKCDLLGLNEEFVDDCGEVSRAVAEEMARGALHRSRAHLAVSITGFAGPGGEGDEEGLVHLALATRQGALLHREEHFGAIGRDGVRQATIESALEMMEQLLRGK